MSDTPVASPSLQAVLTALDQMEAPAATKALARTVGQAREEAGQTIILDELLSAVQSVTAPTGVLSSGLVTAVAGRPESAAAHEEQWTQAQKEERPRFWSDVLRIAGFTLPLLGVGWILWKVSHGGHGGWAPPICNLVAVACSLTGMRIYRKLRSERGDRKRLTPHVPSAEEQARWQRSPVAQAYLRQHTQGDVPLLTMDVPVLNQWAEAHESVQTYLRSVAPFTDPVVPVAPPPAPEPPRRSGIVVRTG